MGEGGEWLFKFLKFSIDFPNFRLNQPCKRSIWQKRSQGCNVLSQLIYLGLKKIVSTGILVDSRLSESGSRFSMDLCQPGLGKNPRKSASLPCPFNYTLARASPKYGCAWVVCHERPPTKSLPGAESLEGVERPLDPPWDSTSCCCWWCASRLGCSPLSWSIATLKQERKKSSTICLSSNNCMKMSFA